ncbi:TPA: heavy metal translocating P-type ATPase [Haemophilus influenzae]|uniref:Copper-exporting P-type ATPase A n=1 Tax=Haemophilus influenzae TaxID=727 RepID=A0ABD6WM32_HAEIF|nr:heavy metal translocating P-type ATPase [Haemophilus influenzae]MCK8804772.1 heavy metal translocating P-type ATPase [Haemophilus influenzae]MCK8897122.1 heavy metal translocating P-type ATPase [Haemophilus influenzae]MCK8972075.1 heavy metal translocating P-type ATPase [Haemophilus influenzae]MCK8983608.1 heavy metal translocating P-type ATPase [Haemophilus influenzae]MCK8986273.1 heavy metal translocating P-type ATPase [Haemophilus influenzae]
MLDLTPQSKKISIQIGGMTCQSCANRIEKVLNKKPFVQQAGVNFAVEEAQVVFDATQASETQIIEIIHKTGFSAHIKQANELPIEENTSIPWRLIILWIINIPFLIGMLGMMSGSHHLMLPPIWQFALASIVQLWLAIPFYRGAIGSIRGGLANMDVLVSTGTLTIYLYSAFMLFYHADHAMGHVYFEASVMVIGFVSLGKFLEDRTKKHSLNSLSMLLQLTPKKVTVLRNEKWSEIALDQVNIGEIIRANQGERIAADGIIESGNGWCDESHLTGESRPEEKQKGGKVLAGAMVTEGSIIYRANQLGSQTLLGDMMNALSDAQGSKAPIARFADKVASVFVPVVLVISLVTFTLTYILTNDSVSSLIHAVSVLVIACPCVLGLATPAAIMVGLGKAVNAGVWFKDAAAMEETAHVDTVVLDKTGTLTKGELEISALWQPQSAVYSEDDLYRFAAAVERQANHPIAKAIVQAAEQKMLEIPTALFSKIEVGQGIQAELEQVGTIKVGKPDYCGLILPKNLEDIWQIASIVAVSINDEPIGAFALTDTLKNDSLHAIQRLQQQNIDVVIMSGDQQSVVDYIAKQLGIKKAFGGLSPRDKAEQIQKLKAQGHIVAMVGDGINDAPALAAANVSFAMKSGSDIAEQTASATLMQHSVNQLVDALFIAIATLKNIKQNLFFALIYNILGIPLAAFGFLSPIIAGAAMALSSISVLMNALRLKKVRF